MNRSIISLLAASLLFPVCLANPSHAADAEVAGTVFPEKTHVDMARLPDLLPPTLTSLAPNISPDHEFHLRRLIQSLKITGKKASTVYIFGTKDSLILFPRLSKEAQKEAQGMPVARISLSRDIDRLNPSLIHLQSEQIKKVRGLLRIMDERPNGLADLHALLDEAFDSAHRNEALPLLGLPNFQPISKYDTQLLTSFANERPVALDAESVSDQHLLGALRPHLPKNYFDALRQLEWEGKVDVDFNQDDIYFALESARKQARPAVYKEFLAAVRSLTLAVADKKVSFDELQSALWELERFEFFKLGLKELPAMKALIKVFRAAEKAEENESGKAKERLELAASRQAAALVRKLDSGTYAAAKFPK